MNDIVSSPFFGLVLSIGAYGIGVFIYRRTGMALANPLLIAIALIAGFLILLDIPLAAYNVGGSFIALFLAPATASLALSIYRQFQLLKENIFPVLMGSAVGSLVSMSSVYGLCRLFQLDQAVSISLIPKSVTTPIAMEISQMMGGVLSITVAAVVVTGIMGAILSPFMIKFFRMGSAIAVGVAIGTSSHAVGTSKAIEIGEVEGAMSGIAIGVSGLITVLFVMVIMG